MLKLGVIEPEVSRHPRLRQLVVGCAREDRQALDICRGREVGRVGGDDHLGGARGLALEEVHQQFLQLRMQVRLGLLDQQDAKRRLGVLRGIGDRRQQHRHVQQVVVAQAVLFHLQRGELADLRAQCADHTLELGVGEGKPALLREPPAAGHCAQPRRDVAARVLDGLDRVQRLVCLLGRGHDEVAVWVPGGGERRDQRNELVVATRPQVVGRVAQGVEVDESHSFSGVRFWLAGLAVAADPLGPDPVVGADRGV